jgi:hypothetical protein
MKITKSKLINKLSLSINQYLMNLNQNFMSKK